MFKAISTFPFAHGTIFFFLFSDMYGLRTLLMFCCLLAIAIPVSKDQLTFLFVLQIAFLIFKVGHIYIYATEGLNLESFCIRWLDISILKWQQSK